MRSLSLGLGLALLLAFPAGAADEAHFKLASAGDLAELCAAPAEPAAIHMCQGYLVGINHMHSAIEQSLGLQVYCLPTDGSVTRDTAARDFATWVAVTPDAAGLSAREGVLQWAHDAFPCK